MKKFIAFILILVFCLSACNGEKQEEPPKTEWKEETPKVEIAPARNDEFHLFEIEPNNPETEWRNVWTNFEWSEDNSVTFQNGYNVITVSKDNEITEKITLSKKPNSELEANFVISDSFILASHRSSNHKTDGVFYYTANGKVKIANATLYDRNGNYIKEYPAAEIKDENGNYTLPVDGKDYVLFHYQIGDGNSVIYWIDDTKAFINLYFRLAIYDFENDEAKILWTKKTAKAQTGISGLDLNQSMGFMGNEFYFGATADRGNDYEEYLFKLTEEGFSLISEGTPHFYAEDFLVLYNKNSIYFMRSGEEKPIKIADFAPFNKHIVLTKSQINFIMEEENGLVFYSYNVNSGVLNRFETELNINATLLKTTNQGDCVNYYFVVYEGDNETNLWKYESETGYAERLSPIDYSVYPYVISPDFTHYIEWKEENGHFYLRMMEASY